MNEPPANPSVPPEARSSPSIGLAITSLVVGILALPFSLLVIGGLMGIVGVILGAIHLTGRDSGRGMAWWGVALSICGIFVAIGMSVFYLKTYRQVIAMMEAGDSGADLNSWAGVLAPDISVVTLDGETIQLSELKGKRVVLDFWATWCPPCVKEIPHFIQIVNETSRDDLVLVGISDEEEGKLKEFVRKHKVNYPIASASDLPSPYSDVTAIPTTFFIDRQGIIQFVITGYHELASLREKAVAADYEGEPKPAPSEQVETPLEPRSPQLQARSLWKKSGFGRTGLTFGNWEGDSRPEILAALPGRKLQVLSLEGEIKSTISLPSQFEYIEAGVHRDGPRLLGYDVWGNKVVVMDGQGKELWSYGTRWGVDGAHWGDLDGDGQDEMIAGMNGSSGLHAVTSEGKEMWTSKLGNVWNQAIVPATGEHPALIFATEAMGSIKVFDPKGKLLRTLKPKNQYFAQMSAARTDQSGAIQVIATGESTVAFDAQGNIAWSAPARMDHGAWRSPSFSSGDVDGDDSHDWIFQDPAGNLIAASASGEQLATFSTPQKCDGFILVPESSKAILVVLYGGTLEAVSFE